MDGSKDMFWNERSGAWEKELEQETRGHNTQRVSQKNKVYFNFWKFLEMLSVPFIVSIALTLPVGSTYHTMAMV